MGPLFRLIFVVLMLGLFITGIFYFIASAISGLAFNPKSRAWKDLLAKLRARVANRITEPLMPCTSENLSELSLKPKILKKAGWRDGVFEGAFSTIYQETILVFAGQQSGRTSVTVAQTSAHEFVFRHKDRETEIWLDGQPYAVFVDNTLVATGKQGRMLARLNADPELRQWSVLMGQGEAATLTNAALAVSPIPRAILPLRKLNPEEEQVLLVLTVIQGLIPHAAIS